MSTVRVVCAHYGERERHKEVFQVCREEVGRKMTACWLCAVLLSPGCLSLHLPPHSTHTHFSTTLFLPEARLWSPWILIHCSATECAQHRSENIWQALFIDPAGGQAESTATRSSLFWSRVPQKSPRRRGAAKPRGWSTTWPWWWEGWEEFFFSFLFFFFLIESRWRFWVRNA